MKHTEHYTVRWHDTDALRQMRPSALMALMQETSSLQFLRAGRSLDAMRDREGTGFIVSRLAFDVLQPLAPFDDIRVETFTCEGRGYTFPRGFLVYRGDDLVARCHSVWALVRIADRTLVRVEEAPLGFGDEPVAETEMPLRFRAPRELAFERVGERTIAFSDLDGNMHMNNTKYPDMVCDFLPDPVSFRVAGMSIAFQREAKFGETLTVERAAAADGVYYFRTTKDGAVYMEAMVKTVSRKDESHADQKS